MKHIFRQDLKKAKEELTSLKDRKKIDDERYKAAVARIKEFKVKHRDAVDKITTLEADLETA